MPECLVIIATCRSEDLNRHHMSNSYVAISFAGYAPTAAQDNINYTQILRLIGLAFLALFLGGMLYLLFVGDLLAIQTSAAKFGDVQSKFDIPGFSSHTSALCFHAFACSSLAKDVEGIDAYA